MQEQVELLAEKLVALILNGLFKISITVIASTYLDRYTDLLVSYGVVEGDL